MTNQSVITAQLILFFLFYYTFHQDINVVLVKNTII